MTGNMDGRVSSMMIIDLLPMVTVLGIFERCLAASTSGGGVLGRAQACCTAGFGPRLGTASPAAWTAVLTSSFRMSLNASKIFSCSTSTRTRLLSGGLSTSSFDRPRREPGDERLSEDV